MAPGIGPGSLGDYSAGLVPVDFIQQLLEDLLAAAEAGIAEPITGNADPCRVFVSHTAPPWDLGDCGQGAGGCATLAVWHGPLEFDQIGDTKCQFHISTQLCIDLLRCVPTLEEEGSAPPDAELTESAAGLNRDIWALQAAVFDFLADEVGCELVTMVPAEPLAPQGGIAGWRFCFFLTLNDPTPTSPAS